MKDERITLPDILGVGDEAGGGGGAGGAVPRALGVGRSADLLALDGRTGGGPAGGAITGRPGNTGGGGGKPAGGLGSISVSALTFSAGTSACRVLAARDVEVRPSS